MEHYSNTCRRHRPIDDTGLGAAAAAWVIDARR